MPAGDWYQYWDDVNGGYLDPAGVERRQERLKWTIYTQGVWKRVPVSQCLEETGKQPIPTQKGDAQNPNLRSRLVVKDIKARKSPEDQLDPAMLFSAMPPLEAVRLLASMLVTKGRSKHGRLLRLGSCDISRAHFYGSPKRNIYVKLPPEEGASDDECGLLCKSMYGTQDAPSIWQTHYTQVLTEAGWKRGRSNGAVFFHPLLDARVLVHGDDFFCLGDDATQEALDRTLRDAYELKRTGTIGIEVEGSKRISFLNRVIRLETIEGRHCAVVEADSRHAELLIEELGLKNGKGVETADVKKSVDQELLEAKGAALPLVGCASCVLVPRPCRPRARSQDTVRKDGDAYRGRLGESEAFGSLLEAMPIRETCLRSTEGTRQAQSPSGCRSCWRRGYAAQHHRHDSFLRKTSDKTREQCTVHHRSVDRRI